MAVKLELWLVAQLSGSSASVKLPAVPFTPPRNTAPYPPRCRWVTGAADAWPISRNTARPLEFVPGCFSLDTKIGPWHKPPTNHLFSPARAGIFAQISITSEFDHDASPLALSVTRLGRGTWRSTLSRPSSPSISPLASGFLQANQPLGGTNTKFYGVLPVSQGTARGRGHLTGNIQGTNSRTERAPSFLLVSHF